MSGLAPDIRINLERSTVLIVDDNPQALDVQSSIFRGFGVSRQHKCGSAKDAIYLVTHQELDLIVIDCSMPEMDGYDFVKWLRRDAPEAKRYTPVIMLTGHAALSTVEKSRDCGANFVVTKPFTPQILLQRIYWVAKDERQIVVCDTYAGPDRRFKNLGAPAGKRGRRRDDLSARLGIAKQPNMDQTDIDQLLKPTRVQL